MDATGERMHDRLRDRMFVGRRFVYPISTSPRNDFARSCSFASLRTCRWALSTKVTRARDILHPELETFCILTVTREYVTAEPSQRCKLPVSPGSL